MAWRSGTVSLRLPIACVTRLHLPGEGPRPQPNGIWGATIILAAAANLIVANHMAQSPRLDLRPVVTEPVVLMISRREVEAADIASAFSFENLDAVNQAADMVEHGNCGFSDCLVVAKHSRQGCDFTATFDRGMRKLPGVKLL